MRKQYCSWKIEMRALCLFCLMFTAVYAHAQQSIKSHYFDRYKCRAQEGCDFFGEGIKQDLLIKYDSSQLRWSKNIFEGWKTLIVRKVTPSYVVALSNELYSLIDLDKKTIYEIDHYRGAYEVWGFGQDTTGLSRNVEKSIGMLEQYQTQKDVIQFLIDQIEKAE